MESKDIVIKFDGEYINAVAHYDDNGYHGHVGYGDNEAAAWMIAHDDMMKA